MQLEVMHTADGSVTLLNKTLNATYHSKFGAIQESSHIFITNGLQPVITTFGKDIQVLEVGFGTGLNAFLTLREATLKQLKVNYFAVEKYPVPETLFNKLNYPEFITEIEKENFEKLLHSKWEEPVIINPFFTITKHNRDVKEMDFSEKAHIIYYDAFAPAIDPELWQAAVFEKLHSVLPEKGCIVTFCAKGVVKRVLKQTGFKVEALKGPPGKREITRAIKNKL